MPDDKMRLDIQVTGQSAVDTLEQSIEKLKQQVGELDKEFAKGTMSSGDYAKAKASLTTQLGQQVVSAKQQMAAIQERMGQAEGGTAAPGPGGQARVRGLSEEYNRLLKAVRETDQATTESEYRRVQQGLRRETKPGGAAGAAGQAEEVGLVSAVMARMGSAAMVAGAASATFAAGAKAVQWAAPDVFAYQMDQFHSVMVDVKQGIGDAIRNWTFGKPGERTVLLETEREEFARKIKDLEDRGKARTLDEEEDLFWSRIELQRLEEGFANFIGMRGQPGREDAAKGQAMLERAQREGLGGLSEDLMTAEFLRRDINNAASKKVRGELTRVQKELDTLPDRPMFMGDFRRVNAQAEKERLEREQMRNWGVIMDETRTNIGKVMKQAFEGMPGAMDELITMLKNSGKDVEQVAKNMERAAAQQRRAMRAHDEELEREDQRRMLEERVKGQAAAMGVPNLMPEQRDLGTGVALAAQRAGVDVEHATRMGIRAIDDKFHQTIRALDDLESNIRARNAMAEMMPRMREMAGRQAHVPIDARMIQNALEEATGAIAEGAFAAPAVWNAMNRQVIRMRANARELRRFGHMFGMLNPMLPQNGGNW